MEQSQIGIITARNVFDSPCIDKYRSIIKQNFDIIYWDRCGIDEECGAANHYRFVGKLDPDAGKSDKLKTYFGFFRFANRILKKHDYDKLIVFPTQTGWLILSKLFRKYRHKYLFEIQDYAGERHKLIYMATAQIIKNARICSLTSPAYTRFLPEREYLISHNIQDIDERIICAYRNRTRKAEKSIILSFIGSVRFIPQQKRILSVFKNDPRFHLNFIGRGSEQLEDFCSENKIENVSLIGLFAREELGKFYMETDMAINIYGNHNPYLDYALSNKLYSAAMMGMPILVCADTYMAEIVKKYGFGFVVDLDDGSCADRVFDYYSHIQTDQLFKGCDAFIRKVKTEEEQYQNTLKEFLES